MKYCSYVSLEIDTEVINLAFIQKKWLRYQKGVKLMTDLTPSDSQIKIVMTV